MATASSILNPTVIRNTDLLNGADALLTNPTDSLLHTDALPVGDVLPGIPVAAGNDSGSDSTSVVPAALPDVGGLTVNPLLTSGALQPEEGVANETIMQLHSVLEIASDQLGVAYTVHGLTNTGETIGLGKIGGDNLVTDVANTPTALLSGDTSTVQHIPADVSGIVTAANGLLQGPANDLAAGNISLQNAPEAIGTLTTFPAVQIAQDAVNALSPTLQTAGLSILPHTTAELGGIAGGAVTGNIGQVAGDVVTAIEQDVGQLPLVGAVLTNAENAGLSILPHTTSGIVSLANVIGVDEPTTSNLLSDVVATPGALLNGDTSTLSHVPTDVTNIATAVDHVVVDAGLDLTGGLGTGMLGGVLGGSGSGPLAPVTGIVGGLAGGAAGSGPLGAVTGVVDGLAGDHSGAGPLAPVTGIVGGLTGDHAGSGLPNVLSGSLGPLTSNGLNLNVAGDPSGSTGHALDVNAIAAPALNTLGIGQTGGHDLVTTAVGPSSTSGLELNALSTTTNPTHVADVNAITVPESAPTIAHVAALPDALHFPAAPSGGTDGLTGVLSTVVTAAVPHVAAEGSAQGGADAGLAHIDLPVLGHADPLSTLGQALHHA